MNVFIKNVVASSALLLTLLSPVYTAAAAPPTTNDVKVQINDKLVTFSDAQPYVDHSQLLHVPVRALGDQLGYETHPEADGKEWKVTLKNHDTTFSFTTGSHTANVNGKPVTLKSAPRFENGRVYVPFRSLADSLNIRVQWDSNNRIAILNEDKQYHAPAWYATRYEKVIEAKATAYTGSSEENGGYANLDYFGNPLQVGTIAVDPNVIPLGTKVYIEGYQYDGLPDKGMFAVATDIGGAVKGNKIDIYVPDSKDKAMKFGIQKVKIYVVKTK